MIEVVGIGQAVVDLIGVVPRFPEVDTKINLISFSKQGGGPVATALVALSRLGVKTAYFGKLGDDEGGRFLLSEFKKEGVNTFNIEIEKGGMTPFSHVVVNKNTGERTIFQNEGRLSPLTINKKHLELIAKAKILLIDRHEEKAALKATQFAKKRGIRIVFDPSEKVNGVTRRLFAIADVPIVPERFAARFSGEEDLRKAIKKLFKFQKETVVITLGENGCIALSDKEFVELPAYKVKAVDTNGAGDVFHGAFVYGMLKNWNLSQKCRFANALAGVKCTEIGGRKGIPTLF